MSEVKLLGTGSYAPEKIVTNDDLAAIMETNDEWIASRTGIRRRHIATEETLTSMSVKAAMQALGAAGMAPEELDMIIVATLTPDRPLPNASADLQDVLGAVNAACFDLSAACTGFLFAMNTACMYIKAGEAKNVLVVGAEVLSKIVNWEDRGTCVLFGDGAGAVVFGASEVPGYLGTVMGSDGSKGYTLTLGAPAIENPFRRQYLEASGQVDPEVYPYVYMDGQEVFKFAVKKVPESILQVLEKTGTPISEVDHFVLHQANKRIIDSVIKRLGADASKFIINMDEYGNTSAASIGLALDEMMRSGAVHQGDLMLISGFGGGLTWGSTLFKI